MTEPCTTTRAQIRAQIQSDHPTFRVWETMPYATRPLGAGGTTVMGKSWQDLAEQLKNEDQ